MLRLLTTPDEQPAFGWRPICTPLGACAHMLVGSAAEEMCSDWRVLINGRLHFVSPPAFAHWFGVLMGQVPAGLAAELLMANNMPALFTELVVADADARLYILELPKHCFNLDAEEWQLVSQAVDIARAIELRLAAREAAGEAAHDN